MASGLLSGFRVVEIAHPLTEYAGLVLAGLGAEVFLVEPPGGASTRARKPRVPNGSDSPRGSVCFLARNTNKKSVVIDPGEAGHRSLLDGLCKRADVILDAEPSPLHSLVESTHARALVTITDRRRLGTSSIVGFAASAGLASSGWPEQAPCNAPSWLALDGASIYAANMALVALFAQRRGAGRMHYEVPYEEAAVAAITPWTRPLLAYEMQAAGQGLVTARLGTGGLPIYEARDGYVRAIAATPNQWRAFVELLGSPEEMVSGPWSDASFRLENADALNLFCSEFTRKRGVEDLFRAGQELGLPITPVYSLRSFRDDPHVRGREIFVEVADPEFGAMELIRPPFKVEPEEWNIGIEPAPALGAHLDEARAVVAEAEPEAPHAVPGLDVTRPLAGLRVLELGVGAVVPEAASLLALLGAEVIKVESLVRVDFLRQVGLAGRMDVNNCPTFNQMNLGTTSIAVDMSQAEGAKLVRKLAATCDIVMENMRGGIVERWGLDYPSVRALREDVIYLSSQGLGQGMYDGFQTYGPNLQTFSGITSQWAHPDDPFAVGTTLNHPDHMAGKQALVPLLAALMRRESSGRGVFIEAAQVEAAAYLISDRYLEQLLADGDLAAPGNTSPDMSPHGCYPCEGEDRWVAIAVEDDDQWQRLCEVVGESWMRDEDLGSGERRVARRDEIDERLGLWTRARDAVDIERSLREVGVSVSRVVKGDDIVADRESHASGFFPAVSHPTAGIRHYTGAPVLLVDNGRPATLRPPLLGEHTERVLYGHLGLTPAEVDDLTARKIVGY
jgi:crotonobetainyl-CoA:carnitine CoA-transferase CaiB-like acyl-CoA transferase